MTNQTTKKCTKCGEEKSISDYSPHARAPLGIQPRCKQCCAEANKARYHASAEVRARNVEYSARWSAMNPEKRVASRAKWRAANPDADRASKQKWVENNREKHRATTEAWRKANLARFNAAGKAWKKRNPEAMFKYHLKKYGLTPEQYRELFAKQGGACAICKKVPTGKRKLGVDHHHASNQHRALLCVPCNAGLGNFREDPRLMMAAIDYLVEHGAAGILEAA